MSPFQPHNRATTLAVITSAATLVFSIAFAFSLSSETSRLSRDEVVACQRQNRTATSLTEVLVYFEAQSLAHETLAQRILTINTFHHARSLLSSLRC